MGNDPFEVIYIADKNPFPLNWLISQRSYATRKNIIFSLSSPDKQRQTKTNKDKTKRISRPPSGFLPQMPLLCQC